MARDELTRSQVLELLRTNPEEISACTQDLSDWQAAIEPEPGQWSVNEILAHLRACADMWGEAIQTMLEQDHPRIKAVNPRHWIHSTDYPDRRFSASFAEFQSQRTVLLVALEGLSLEQWERRATVYGAGKELERSVFFYAQWLATHERSHLRAIAGAARLAKMEFDFTSR